MAGASVLRRRSAARAKILPVVVVVVVAVVAVVVVVVVVQTHLEHARVCPSAHTRATN